MVIKDMVRKALLNEAKKGNYSYSCVMIYMDVDKKDWNDIQDLIDENDLYVEKDDDSFGRTTYDDVHVTVLYGIHSDVPDKDVEEKIDKITKPDMKLKKVSDFKNNKYNVLKIDVESGDLVKLNKEFKKLPYTSDFDTYHAHITVAYLKPNKSDKYIKLMNEREPIKVDASKIVFSKPNGEKKNYKLK